MSVAKFIYICQNKTCPVNFYTWFKLTTQIHSHNTSSQYIEIGNSITMNNLFIPSARTSNIFIKNFKKVMIESYDTE